MIEVKQEGSLLSSKLDCNVGSETKICFLFCHFVFPSKRWLPKLFFKESKFETRSNVESIKCHVFPALWIPPLFEDLFTTNSITQNCFHLPNILGSLGRQYCLAVKRISFTDSAISKLNWKMYFLEMFDVFPRRGKYNFWL